MKLVAGVLDNADIAHSCHRGIGQTCQPVRGKEGPSCLADEDAWWDISYQEGKCLCTDFVKTGVQKTMIPFP